LTPSDDSIYRFTVNLISEPFIEAANYTCIDAPADIDEWALSGLTPVPSSYWGNDGPPRVGESAFSLECELHDHLPLKDDDGKRTSTIIVGRVRNYVLNEEHSLKSTLHKASERKMALSIQMLFFQSVVQVESPTCDRLKALSYHVQCGKRCKTSQR